MEHAGDPLNDKRIAAYEAVDNTARCVGFQGSKISPKDIEALYRAAAQQGDARAQARIITAELDRYRARLLESPWVADAALRRLLPSTIEVFVSERQPMGICRLRSQLYLIDRDGTIIDEFGPQYAEFDLPIVDGLVRAPRDREASIDPAGARFAARVIDDLAANRPLLRRVSQIDVSDPHDAVVLLDDDAALLRLGEERFLDRLKGYLEVAAALRERVPDIDYVDLRFDERVYVRPRGGNSVVPAARTRGASKF